MRPSGSEAAISRGGVRSARHQFHSVFHQVEVGQNFRKRLAKAMADAISHFIFERGGGGSRIVASGMFQAVRPSGSSSGRDDEHTRMASGSCMSRAASQMAGPGDARLAADGREEPPFMPLLQT